MSVQTDKNSVEQMATWQDDFGDPAVAKTLRALSAAKERENALAETLRAMIKDAQAEITANMTDVMPSRDVENLWLGRKIGLEMALAKATGQ